MKLSTLKTPAFLLFLTSSFSFAELDNHSEKEPADHEEHVEDCGESHLIIESKAGFRFEVSVDDDRKAKIVFLDQNQKPMPLTEQKITGIAGERSAPTKLSFSPEKGDEAKALISDQALPSGEHIAMILMIQISPDAKAVAERFELHLH